MFREYHCFDFDGTIVTHEFPKMGKPIQKTINFIRHLKAQGCVIILWTCREGKYLDEAVQFCADHDVPIDYVNENPEQDFPSRKPFAHAYWDDRGWNVKDIPLVEGWE